VTSAIVAENETDLRNKIDYLNSILYTNNAVPIIFKDEPDVTYFGEYEGDPSWEDFRRHGRGTLPFICYDPYTYYKEKTSTGDITLGLGISALPIIQVKFNDNVDEFMIRHNQTRKHLRIKRNFIIGDVLELNARNRRVRVN